MVRVREEVGKRDALDLKIATYSFSFAKKEYVFVVNDNNFFLSQDS